MESSEDTESGPQDLEMIHKDEPDVEIEDEELHDWKTRMRELFECWLENVEEPPEMEHEQDAPDLYSLFEELAALRNESRKGNRKSAEVFTQFGSSLGGFQEEIGRLRTQLAKFETGTASGDIPRSHALGLVEMLDRMYRLDGALKRMPAPGKLPFLLPNSQWKTAWASFQTGFDILLTHVKKLAEQSGITVMKTIGTDFNPTTMVAVAATPVDGPANKVIEEIAPGYLLRDEVLRVAEVNVSKSIS